MRIVQDIVDVFTLVLIILGILFAGLFFGVRLFGITPYNVTSNSMAPLYPQGSVIYVAVTEPEQMKEGEVITFTMGENLVASHQVYENDVTNQQIRTQGINNHDENGNILQDAEPVPYANVLGKVVFGIPFLGIIHEFLTTPPGLYYAIGMLAFAVLLNCVVSMAAGANRKKLQEEIGG